MMSEDLNNIDLDSLCDSEREELEHALYSQIHYEPNDTQVDYSDYGYNGQNFSLTSTDHQDPCNAGQEVTRSFLDLLNIQKTDTKINHDSKLENNLSKESDGEPDFPKLQQEIKPKLNLSKNLKPQNKLNSLIKRRKDDNDEKSESKYNCRIPKKNTPAKQKAIIDSDRETDDSESLTDLSSDRGSIITLSDDSDSDSSSMCGKIFTKDLKPADIQLNINNITHDDSNGENDFCDILSTTDNKSSDDDDKWQVSEQDIIGSRPEIIRYYEPVKNVRCKNCREKGHLSRDCPKPKVTVCYLCGRRDHLSTSCPEPLCYNCSKPGHISTECQQAQYKWYIKCSRCEMPGHQLENCPDTWRRFHLTTVGEPRPVKVKVNPRKFCCNCGSYKHFGYKCNRPPMSSHAQITNPFIISYDPPLFKTKKKSQKKYFNDSDETLEPVIKRKKIELIGIGDKDITRRGKKSKVKELRIKSQDPLKNFKKIMKDYKSVKDKNNKKKQKVQKAKNNIQKKSAFVKSAKISNLDDKLFNYTDKKLKQKNKSLPKKNSKIEKIGKRKKKNKKGIRIV